MYRVDVWHPGSDLVNSYQDTPSSAHQGVGGDNNVDSGPTDGCWGGGRDFEMLYE